MNRRDLLIGALGGTAGSILYHEVKLAAAEELPAPPPDPAKSPVFGWLMGEGDGPLNCLVYVREGKLEASCGAEPLLADSVDKRGWTTLLGKPDKTTCVVVRLVGGQLEVRSVLLIDPEDKTKRFSWTRPAKE